MENTNGKKLPPPISLEISQQPSSSTPTPLHKIILVASIAAGVQFGWALQLSLLTPYVQLLGIPHEYAAYIWLCGPISGMIVQPLVGYYSDKCKSKFGRRRPFIAAGAALVAVAVFLIGFAADLGHASGDPLGKGIIKPRAIAVFVVGFWILDVANNTLQGPCRAFLADLSGGNNNRMRTANAVFSFFMAVGNVLGYSAGSLKHIHKMFPFAETIACDRYCANLKTCFIISIALLAALTTIALTLVKEPEPESLTSDKIVDDDDTTGQNCCMRMPFFGEIIGALKDLSRPMWLLLLVTFFNWLAWFPFTLFNTDWMGREVYGGKPNEGDLYNDGVSAGSLGLMINAIVLGFASIAIPYLSKLLGGVNRLWGGVNFLLSACLFLTILVTKLAEKSQVIGKKPDTGIIAGALTLFGVLGVPQAITFSIPFALASIFSSHSGAGQGLSLGVLNISICVAQMIVSFLSGPWDTLFGGGNLPAFIFGAISAALSGILALTLLPTPKANAPTMVAGGMH